MVQIDASCCCRNDSAHSITSVPYWELLLERLRVVAESLLLGQGVAIAVLIGVEHILSKEGKHDASDLVDVVDGLAVGLLESDEDFDHSWGTAEDFLCDSDRLNELVDEEPREPKAGLGHLIWGSASPANCSSHLSL